MRRKLFLLLTISLLVWCSCSKNEIKPNDPATSNPEVPLSMHISTASLNATSYTASSPINLNGSHDITISGKSIKGGSVPSITLSNCYNVHITQNSLGNSTDAGIYLYHCYNITIDYNYITNVSVGVYVDHTTGGGIAVNNNQFLNMQGPFPRGQFVQFNTVSGPNNTIDNNKCENIAGQSNSQEGINLYMSNGTSSSPITINGNWIRGGGPGSASGGIQLGDTGGSYETASNNIIVNPGQMGLSISGGDHLSFINNTVFAKAQYFTNVGVVVWGQAGARVTNSTVKGNKVNFTNSSYAQNDSWLASGEATPAGWGTNIWGANISASILPATIISTSAATTPIPVSSTQTSSASSSPSSGTQTAPITMNGRNNVTISGLQINGGNVPCIKLTNCSNIYITQCSLGNSTNVGIELDNCTNVTIEKNNIFNVAAGIVAINCPNGGINVFTNQMKNMQGQVHNGAFVQFTSVNGGNNNISSNKFENIMGQSNPGDAIDILQSHGASSSPIVIDGNWILGGGPSTSGGGIKLGDNGGSYQVASNNILVNPGQFGLCITGGDHISLTGNSLFGKAQSFTNVGIYVWSQGGIAITNSTVSGNKVNFTNSQYVENDSWLASGVTAPSGWYSNNWGANISASILPSSIVSF